VTHRLSRSPKGYYVLVGPYDPDLVDDLKRIVPSHARQWLPTAKAWRIDEEYRDAVQQMIDGRAQP
jgi:hypothetical protein